MGNNLRAFCIAECNNMIPNMATPSARIDMGQRNHSPLNLTRSSNIKPKAIASNALNN